MEITGEGIGIINYHYDEIMPIDSSIEEISIHNTSTTLKHIIDILNTNQLDDFDQAAQEQSDNSILVRKSRIKEKINKAKNKLPEKVKAIKKMSVIDKKQKQLVRNRLSAQKSRERKRQELLSLKETNELLIKSKCEVEERLALVTTELETIKTIVDLLSPESREEFNRISDNLHQEQYLERKSPRCRGPSLILGALLGCLCIIGCFSAVTFGGIFVEDSLQARILVEPEFDDRPALIELQYVIIKILENVGRCLLVII